MLCDSDTDCVAIALALCIKMVKNRRWTKECYKWTPQDTKILWETSGWVSQTTTIFFCCRMTYHLMSYCRLLPLTSLKQILTCEKQSLTVSVYPLRYAIWTLEILLKSLYIFLGMLYCSADRRELNGYCAILSDCSVFSTLRNSVHRLLSVFDIAQYCPQTVQCFRGCPMKSNFVWLTQYAIQPLNIKTIQSTILCIINYCTVFWLSRGTFSNNYCLLGCGTCRLVKNKR